MLAPFKGMASSCSGNFGDFYASVDNNLNIYMQVTRWGKTYSCYSAACSVWQYQNDSLFRMFFSPAGAEYIFDMYGTDGESGSVSLLRSVPGCTAAFPLQ